MLHNATWIASYAVFDNKILCFGCDLVPIVRRSSSLTFSSLCIMLCFCYCTCPFRCCHIAAALLCSLAAGRLFGLPLLFTLVPTHASTGEGCAGARLCIAKVWDLNLQANYCFCRRHLGSACYYCMCMLYPPPVLPRRRRSGQRHVFITKSIA
jgi:hypothetical protein